MKPEDVLLSFKQLPVLQNRVYSSRDDAASCVKGDVDLAQDPATGIVCNRSFDPSLLVYDEHYQNEQAVSQVFQEHLDQVADIVVRHFAGRPLTEIGCGKGFFLKLLRERGLDVTGMDPAYEGNDPTISRQMFGAGGVLSSGGVVLRHVLEHVNNPVEFLASVAASQEGRGRIYIEVPSLEWIVEQRAWYDVYYEHVNYFRASDFRRLFSDVLEEGRFFNGQYLYVVADMAAFHLPCGAVDPIEFNHGMESGIADIAAQFQEKECVIWGGASKGVLAALHLSRQGGRVEFLIDINPAKQGRYAAGTGLEILSPKEAFSRLKPGADILVVNSNYIEEIREISEDRYNYIQVDKHDI